MTLALKRIQNRTQMLRIFMIKTDIYGLFNLGIRGN